MTPPPPHQTEKIFRRFETVILDVIDGYPNHVAILDPRDYDLSINTVVARLRDAINSLCLYNWSLSRPCPRIAELLAIRKTLVVVRHDSSVLFGPSSRVTNVSSAPSRDVAYDLHFSPAATAIVQAFCVLHSHRIMQSRTILHNCPSIPMDQFDIFDCSVVPDPSNLTITIV